MTYSFECCISMHTYVGVCEDVHVHEEEEMKEKIVMATQFV